MEEALEILWTYARREPLDSNGETIVPTINNSIAAIRIIMRLEGWAMGSEKRKVNSEKRATPAYATSDKPARGCRGKVRESGGCEQSAQPNIDTPTSTCLVSASPKERKLHLDKLENLVEGLRTNKNYCKSPAQRKKTDEHIDYRGVSERDNLKCRVLCQNCIKVCPNRANTFVETPEGKWILHIDDACNECGNCQFSCVQPCHPFRDRFTLFSSKEMMQKSENKGVAFVDNRFYVRLEKDIEEYQYNELPKFAKEVVDSIRKTHLYLVE